LSKSHQLTRQVSTFSQTENELRSQLNIYVEKFKQVSTPHSIDQHSTHIFTPAIIIPLELATFHSRVIVTPLTNTKQVEDTLNNSNDLFLTFRKEMEEMSKKTKRLEKENMQLTRKQEATNKNIFQMAEERSNTQKLIDQLQRENEKLKKLCRAMQTNGYGRADLVSEAVEGDEEDEEEDLGETDSEYDEYEEDDDEEVESSEDDYDEDTEEEAAAAAIQQPQPRAFGPVPPPPPPPTQASTDALRAAIAGPPPRVNGVNGRH